MCAPVNVSAPQQKAGASAFVSAPKFTDDKFTIKRYAQALLEEMDVTRCPDSEGRECVYITGCSGVGTPGFALGGLLGKKNIREVFAVERKPEAAWFLLTNTKPGHVFCEMSEVTHGPCARCYAHCGKLCPIPALRPHLYICGFSCKPHSTKNTSRFSADNLADPQMDSFFQARAQVLKMSPLIAIMENVLGILMRRGGKEETDQKSIDFFLHDKTHGLCTLPGYTASWIKMDGLVLPTTRPRVYFVVVADELGVGANDVASRVALLRDAMKKLPVHNLDSFPEASTCREWTSGPWNDSECDEADTSLQLSRNAEYASMLQSSFDKACKARRLPAGAQLPECSARTSAAFFGLRLDTGLGWMFVKSFWTELQCSRASSAGQLLTFPSRATRPAAGLTGVSRP